VNGLTGIGQHLPAKQTTKHVAKQPLPEGAVNSKGFQKVRDRQTGRIKYVDRKKGVALDNSGDLTHERY
jgi:hypothetical protein